MSKFRTRFHVAARYDDVLAIVDDCQRHGCQSVTNGAEEVVDRLVALGSRKLIYCDTQGYWDEILVADGKFAGFLAIGVAQLDHALDIVRMRTKGDGAR